ncbi:MAG: DegV family protein [Candidatus Coproplasma sp.]
MENFEIFVDSAANLTDELIAKHNITVVPYTCSINGEEMECYQKDVPFDEISKKFYDAMREGAETKTTLINADKFIDAITPVMQEGKDVLLFVITTKLSGTYNQALAAKERLKEQFPDRKLLVVDSFNASLGEGLMAVYAAEKRDKGEDIESVYKWACDNVANMNSFVTVSSLKYLKRTGRVNAAKALIGTMLKINPVVWGSHRGELEVLCNVRGRKKAISKLVELFKDRVIDPENQHIAIAHADCLEEAEQLAEMIKEAGAKEVIINMYDLCTGAHIGPGTIALFFMGKKRDSNIEC